MIVGESRLQQAANSAVSFASHRLRDNLYTEFNQEDAMQITAHDENALTNLLFSEIHRHELLPAFLNTITWRNHASFTFAIREATLHQQVGLSEFGRPDALIVIVDKSDHVHVIVVESKLRTYAQSCGHNLLSRRFNNAINTKLNNQLSLRYRAFRSLRSLYTFPGCLSEQEHVDHSPYSTDCVRRCQHIGTRRLMRSFAPDASFYLVALTSDRDAIFDRIGPSHHFFPLFFNQETQKLEDEFQFLGSTNWHACNAAFGKLTNHFTPSYQALFEGTVYPTYNSLDIPEISPRLGARQIVEYNGKTCLYSVKGGGSYRLYEWTRTGFELIDEATRDIEKFASLRPLLQPIQRAPKINRVGHYDDWLRFFENLEQKRRPT